MAGFDGLRVIAFESRRAAEMAQLIRHYGGEPIVAPSTREVETPNHEERKLIEGILNKNFDIVIFMTGVGARALIRAAASLARSEEFLSALAGTSVVVRGPKPAAVMREFQIPMALKVPEPNTWREIVAALDAHPEKVAVKNSRVAVQEHGEPSLELYSALRQRGAEVSAARVYRWELPEDIRPLERAIGVLIGNQAEVVLFTSSVQYLHATEVAAKLGVTGEFSAALKRAMVASIGPTTSQTLSQHGIEVDLEPSHAKMGFLVREAAERSAVIIQRKAARQAEANTA
jgi:uroporphyrinogen-III synthase